MSTLSFNGGHSERPVLNLPGRVLGDPHRASSADPRMVRKWWAGYCAGRGLDPSDPRS
jgi:hypothetical protein